MKKLLFCFTMICMFTLCSCGQTNNEDVTIEPTVQTTVETSVETTETENFTEEITSPETESLPDVTEKPSDVETETPISSEPEPSTEDNEEIESDVKPQMPTMYVERASEMSDEEWNKFCPELPKPNFENPVIHFTLNSEEGMPYIAYEVTSLTNSGNWDYYSGRYTSLFWADEGYLILDVDEKGNYDKVEMIGSRWHSSIANTFEPSSYYYCDILCLDQKINFEYDDNIPVVLFGFKNNKTANTLTMDLCENPVKLSESGYEKVLMFSISPFINPF